MPSCSQALSEAYRSYHAWHGSVPGGVLLDQTIAVAPLHEAFVDLVTPPAGAVAVDLGCGFGPVCFSMALISGVEVLGVDVDESVLSAAREIASVLGDRFCRWASVSFGRADATRLPIADATADIVTTSLLLQHVRDVPAVLAEAARILRRGGVFWAMDIDDGLGVSWPPDEARAILEDAFDKLQGMHGDREVGRKLPVLAAAAGLHVTRVVPLPIGGLVVTSPASRALVASRLSAARGSIVEAGLLGASEFDAAMKAFRGAPARLVSRIATRVVVEARKP